MTQVIHRIRLFFCFFSGEDDYIIRKCGGRIQLSFALIGLFVLMIFIGCWESAFLFMSHLFEENKIASVFVAIIWAMLVTNIYLLLLYTISPTLMPLPKKIQFKPNNAATTTELKITKYTSAFSFSFTLRISLILLLSIIIAQPFNVLIFSPSFEESNLYANEIRSILSKHPLAWIITIFACVLFILPVYWKYAMRNRSEFYEKKKDIENKIVLDSYTDFKNIYQIVLNNKVNSYNRKTWANLMPLLNSIEKVDQKIYNHHFTKIQSDLSIPIITKYEYWTDHPFRTIKKEQNKFLSSEKELLKIIYQEKG